MPPLEPKSVKYPVNDQLLIKHVLILCRGYVRVLILNKNCSAKIYILYLDNLDNLKKLSTYLDKKLNR